jgi:phosphate transport system protein
MAHQIHRDKRFDDMTEHTVKAYEQELHELVQMIAEMGGLAERQIRDAIAALIKRDADLANRAITADDAVDQLQHRIEQQAIHMIAKRQPLASDLRAIVGALRISIDLERIGDFAKNIGKRIGALTGDSYPNHLMKRLQQMADLSLVQIKDVLDSYTQCDVAKAVAVWKRDEEIDEMYTSLFRELLTYMMEEPRNITFSTHLLFCAKNIERIGDHTTNIAETVYYMVAGVPLKDGRPKGDLSSLTAAPFPA